MRKPSNRADRRGSSTPWKRNSWRLLAGGSSAQQGKGGQQDADAGRQQGADGVAAGLSSPLMASLKARSWRWTWW
jgi:hypothetical protein